MTTLLNPDPIDPSKKNSSLLSRHKKEKALLYICCDILVAGSLIFGGVVIGAIFDSFQHNREMLTSSGMTPLSYGELINIVKNDSRDSNWIGYTPGSIYTLNNTIPNIYVISYFAEGTNPKYNSPYLKVITFKNIEAFRYYSELSSSPIKWGDLSNKLNFTTIYGSYDTSIIFANVAPTFMVISSEHDSEITFLVYQTPRSASSLLSDAEKVVSVY